MSCFPLHGLSDFDVEPAHPLWPLFLLLIGGDGCVVEGVPLLLGSFDELRHPMYSHLIIHINRRVCRVQSLWQKKGKRKI